jgi:basic amino acid/polyamine antiporter, APA family
MNTSDNSKITLKRSLGLPMVTFYGLGTIIGAGIYVLLGSVADFAGDQLPYAFMLAGCIAMFTALSYAELAARLPYAAGAMLYVDQAWGHRQLSTVVGLLLVLTGIVSAGTLANGFVGYLNIFINANDVIALTLLVLVMGCITCWDIKLSATVVFVITTLEIIGLLVVMGYAWHAEPVSAPVVSNAGYGMRGTLTGVLLGSFVAFYAFIGFEDMVNIAEEVKRPKRNMPIAIILSIVVAMLLYLGVSIAALHVVPAAVLANSEAPMSLVMNAAGGSSRLIAAISLIAVINGAMVQIIMASRVLYGMAQRQLIPQFLARINATTRTPIRATVMVVAVLLMFALSLPLTRLAQLTSLLMLVIFVLINLALITLKRRAGTDYEGLDLPLWLPIVGALSALALLSYQVVTSIYG